MRVLQFLFRRLGPLAPRLMGRAGLWLWRRTRRFPITASEQRLRDKARRQAVGTPFGRVMVYHWGAGPAVLLVHGWNGRATQMAGFVSPLVRAGYRVVAMDAPGHGDSTGRQSSVLAVAAALLAVAQEQRPYHAAVTHSFGCAGLLNAMSNGLQVDRVACISPPNRFEWLIAAYAQALEMPSAVQVAMMRQLEARYGAEFWERVAPDSLAAGLRIPGLIIHDRDDNQVPWRQGRDIARAWPGAEFVLTRGQGHSRILYHRDTIRRVLGFIGRPGWGEIRLALREVERSRWPGKVKSCFDSRLATRLGTPISDKLIHQTDLLGDV